jgi:FkbM family methyltransferase
MATLRSVLRYAFHKAGGQRVRIAAQRTALRWRSGAFRNDIGVLMYADPADQRGTLLATYQGRLDRNAVSIWRRLVTEFRPTVAIDIGANYGEVAFSTRYRGLRELHLVEPNPTVLHWLRRTVRDAPDDFPRIVLHEGAASDQSGNSRLNYHEHSGVASLRVPSDRGVLVPCFRLDDRITLTDEDSLLFKIDVEGHEQAALEGMSGLLRGRRAVGICEILHAETSLLDYLGEHFSVSLVRQGREQPVNGDELKRTVRRARESGRRWGELELGKDVVLRCPTGF